MIDWTSIKTAYKVAKLGTVSAAAEELGIHRASVVRHIDSVEEQLGRKIFIRNHRGYKVTEFGLDLIETVGQAELQLNLLLDRSQSQSGELSGELIISSDEFRPAVILPAIAHFRSTHPKVHLRLVSGENLGQLELGESHIILQELEAKTHPDYVIQELNYGEIRLFASKNYIRRYGMPMCEDDLKNHRFFKPPRSRSRPDFGVWLERLVPKENFFFTSNSFELAGQAILEGLIIGFVPTKVAAQNDELIPILPAHPAWNYSFQVATHRDMHRTPKVQAFLNILKQVVLKN